MLPLELSLLEPPYHDVAPLVGRPPALGAIAVARADGPRGFSTEMATLLDRAPWTVPCVVLRPSSVTPSVLQRVWELPGQPAFVVVTQPGDRLLPAGILTAIANRPAPLTPLLVAYVVRRTGSVILGQSLDQIWAARDRSNDTTAERTIRYRLRRLGKYGRYDWIRIRRLIRAKVEGRNLTVEQRAQLVGTEARTLRGWIARYLGTTMKNFRAMAGWEWILETALRRGGFPLDQPGPAAARRQAEMVGA
ncbi:MAG: hypothetical protein JNJ80_09150 [Gemmatimonadetes bacterium]|nr:hypothetical protein [Gemmatimonadota bacterium]